MTQRMRKVGLVAESAIEDAWHRQATAAAIAAARGVVKHDGPIPPGTPIGRLGEIEWGWLVAAILFGWISTRAQQAAAEQIDAEQVIRLTGLDPDPWDAGAVAAILSDLADTPGIDWSNPLTEWPRETMVEFLTAASTPLEHTTDSDWWRGRIGVARSVPEVAPCREDHRHSCGVGRGYHLGVALRAARLDQRGDTRIDRYLGAVCEGEERIGCRDRPFGPVAGSLHREAAGVDAVDLAHADADCGGGVGSCTSNNRTCFLTGGLTTLAGTNTLIAQGAPDTPVNDTAHPTLGAVFCVGPTGSTSVNNVAGLPGPGRITLKGTARALP